MLEQAEELTGERVPVTLADGGYNITANLEAGQGRGQTLVIAERSRDALKDHYFIDQFSTYFTDSYICPVANVSIFVGFAIERLSSVNTALIEPRNSCRVSAFEPAPKMPWRKNALDRTFRYVIAPALSVT
jgi:hypothetical protein